MVSVEAIAHDCNPCELFPTPVCPQQIVVHSFGTVGHEEQCGLAGSVLAVLRESLYGCDHN